jgi:hypothetical protein
LKANVMAATQVHIIDPCAGGMVVVMCEDGSRVLFGASVHGCTHNDIAQRLFEVLEDGQIDYFIHPGVDPEGRVDLSAINEFFPIKACVELAGNGIAYPQAYLDFRGSREVETMEIDDVLGFGKTSIRLIGAAEPRIIGGQPRRPVALHVAHEEDEDTVNAVVVLGATGGGDWRDAEALGADPAKAFCLVVDGRRPLDIVITTGDRPDVGVDHLAAIAPSTIVIGSAPSGTPDPLRGAARALYDLFTRQTGDGHGVVEIGAEWLGLIIDGSTLRFDREPRAVPQAQLG